MKAKELLSRLEVLVDPFDLEVSSPRLSSAVTLAYNGLTHLYAPLMRPGVGLQISSAKTPDGVAVSSDSASVDLKSANSMFMSLATGRGRPSFTTLPLGLSTCFDKRRSKPNSSSRARMVRSFHVN
ncbi:unnamed protein product [Echinostoma caproni]|uniref:Amidase domain-containing protein n=1 Tax=Echinostoma caproni TaxID=27848 RepID=A0A183BD98_9TREM|nr:unnamed protein product [Echinostoma caproni]